MKDFYYDIGTKIYFGKNSIENLGKVIKETSDNVFLCYGKNSIKTLGIYDEVIKQFKENNISWTELSGIDPNPRIDSVREGARLCREHGITAVLAVGGGSTIDCGKVIAAAVSHEGEPWDLVTGTEKIKSVLPVFSVLTL